MRDVERREKEEDIGAERKKWKGAKKTSKQRKG